MSIGNLKHALTQYRAILAGLDDSKNQIDQARIAIAATIADLEQSLAAEVAHLMARPEPITIEIENEI